MLTVAQLIEKLGTLPQDQEVIVWTPGTKMELSEVFEVFDYPREKFVVMIEGNVIGDTLSKES
jgi:sulfur carrier protein ThiS